MEQKEYKGYTGKIILTDTGVIIKRSFLGGGLLRGDKTIPYSSIVAVQLKKAGLAAGYIQLTLVGGSEAKGDLFEAVSDENSICFHAFNNKNQKFAEAKELIEKRIGQPKGTAANSNAHELEKFADLRDKGIITEAEFQAKKKALLGL